mgnify:CR=1 FL=1
MTTVVSTPISVASGVLPTSAPTKTVKAHCNRCLGEKHHFVLAAKKQEQVELEPDGFPSYWENTVYEMLECCGCDNIILRSTFKWVGGDPGEATVTYFPPAVTRPKPAWLTDYSSKPGHDLLREIYAALHNGSNRLAIMGARTIIDMVMLNKIGDQGTFAEKLEKMEQAGYISKTNRTYLEAAIEAGHAAAHRGHRHDDKDVNHVMDIVENLVQAVYVLESNADTLRRNTPPRPPKSPIA